MAYDENGIYQHAPGDAASPFPEMLNTGMQSVSDVIGPHVYDTGWQSVTTFTTGWMNRAGAGSSNHLEYRRVGYTVEVRGLVERSGADATSNTDVFTLPVGLRPSQGFYNIYLTNGIWITNSASAGTAHTHQIMASSVTGPFVRGVLNPTGVFNIVIPTSVTIPTGSWVAPRMTFFVG